MEINQVETTKQLPKKDHKFLVVLIVLFALTVLAFAATWFFGFYKSDQTSESTSTTTTATSSATKKSDSDLEKVDKDLDSADLDAIEKGIDQNDTDAASF